MVRGGGENVNDCEKSGLPCLIRQRMRSSRVWLRSSQVWMRSGRVWMRS